MPDGRRRYGGMPLTRRVLDWVASLGRQLLDPSVALVDVALPAENLAIVARILEGWAARECGSTLVVGVELGSADAFTRSLSNGLGQLIAGIQSAGAQAVRTGEPPPIAERAGNVHAAVEDAERVALWAGDSIRRIALAGRVPPDGIPPWLVPAIEHGGDRIPWIVLRDASTTATWGATIERRAAACVRDDPAELREQLGAIRRGVGSPVLVCDAPYARVGPLVTQELGYLVESDVVHIEVTTYHPRAIALAVLERLGMLEASVGAEPVLELARAMEAQAVRRPLVVVVALRAEDPWRSDVMELGDQLSAWLVTRRARMVVVGPGAGASPPSRVVSLPLRIDAAALEEGLRERLAGECSDEERCQFEASLAASASARGEHREALERAARATSLAFQSTGSASLRMAALSIFGSVLAHADEPDAALGAFTRCAWLADALGDQVVVGRLLCSIGHVHARLGAIETAVRCYHGAAAIARSVNDDAGCAGASTCLADLFREAGDVERAAAILHALTETSATLPQLDALFALARGQAHACLGALFDDAGVRARAQQHREAAAEAGYRGPVCACPRA